MKDWIEKLNAFLKFSEYEKYRVIQGRMIESDFDREVKKLLTGKKRKRSTFL